MLAALPEDQVWFLAPKLGGPQPDVPPAPPMIVASVSRPHIHSIEQVHIHINKNFQNNYLLKMSFPTN